MNRRVVGKCHILTAVCLILLAARGAFGQCCGDCSGDGAVTVDEILTTVNHALTSCSDDGIPSMATCPSDVANNRTNLLYPFVSNQSGFDTGISISNTGDDRFGTHLPACPGGGCRCTLYFFGANAAPSVSTDPISPGVTYATVTSSVAPNFQGYVIAACNFPYAHGFAFLSDIGVHSVATGYLAEVICSDRGSTGR